MRADTFKINLDNINNVISKHNWDDEKYYNELSEDESQEEDRSFDIEKVEYDKKINSRKKGVEKKIFVEIKNNNGLLDKLKDKVGVKWEDVYLKIFKTSFIYDKRINKKVIPLEEMKLRLGINHNYCRIKNETKPAETYLKKIMNKYKNYKIKNCAFEQLKENKKFKNIQKIKIEGMNYLRKSMQIKSDSNLKQLTSMEKLKKSTDNYDAVHDNYFKEESNIIKPSLTHRAENKIFIDNSFKMFNKKTRNLNNAENYPNSINGFGKISFPNSFKKSALTSSSIFHKPSLSFKKETIFIKNQQGKEIMPTGLIPQSPLSMYSYEKEYNKYNEIFSYKNNKHELSNTNLNSFIHFFDFKEGLSIGKIKFKGLINNTGIEIKRKDAIKSMHLKVDVLINTIEKQL